MSWRWIALGPNGRILHLVQAWHPNAGRALRFDAACGSRDNTPVPTLIEDDGTSYCVLCFRKVLHEEPKPP